MRGLGRLNVMEILKKIIFSLIAGPMGLVIGGGSILTMVAAYVLTPIVGPHIQRMLGGLQGSVGSLGSRVA
jgi:hypothetical protein